MFERNYCTIYACPLDESQKLQHVRPQTSYTMLLVNDGPLYSSERFHLFLVKKAKSRLSQFQQLDIIEKPYEQRVFLLRSHHSLNIWLRIFRLIVTSFIVNICSSVHVVPVLEKSATVVDPEQDASIIQSETSFLLLMKERAYFRFRATQAPSHLHRQFVLQLN